MQCKLQHSKIKCIFGTFEWKVRNFYSYQKWENVDYNTNSVYFSKQVKVEKGYYYRLRGYHSCTKNGVTENGGSVTDGIYIG